MRGMKENVQIAWFVAPARPQHETDSSLPDRISDQQYHRICRACQKRERDMQVQAGTGCTPASVRLRNRIGSLILAVAIRYCWMSLLCDYLRIDSKTGAQEDCVEPSVSRGRLLGRRIITSNTVYYSISRR